jgi:hypothetical protein
LAKDKAKHDKEKGPKGIAAEWNMAHGEKKEIIPEAGTSSQQPPNRIVRFFKLDYPVSPGLGQRGILRTIMPGMAATPHWCLVLTSSQRRGIQQMRLQKLREEAAEKERDEHFNTIQPMVPMKQEWRAKEKTSVPVLIASDDDMDLLDNDESPLIKDGSPPPTGMDINMVFMLPAEFRGVEEEVTQMCLGPRETIFEKPEELSQQMKPLYIRGHIDGRRFPGCS